jgi:hypothetical protein
MDRLHTVRGHVRQAVADVREPVHDGEGPAGLGPDQHDGLFLRAEIQHSLPGLVARDR